MHSVRAQILGVAGVLIGFLAAGTLLSLVNVSSLQQAADQSTKAMHESTTLDSISIQLVDKARNVVYSVVVGNDPAPSGTRRLAARPPAIARTGRITPKRPTNMSSASSRL